MLLDTDGDAELVLALVPVAEERVVESVPGGNENEWDLSGQAESELILDVDIEEVVADESALVSLSVSLVCVSLGFESDGEGSFGSLGPLESSPYVLSLPTLQRAPTDSLEDPLVGGLLQLLSMGSECREKR